MKQLGGADLLQLHAARSRAGGTPPLLLLDVREPWEIALASIRIEQWPPPLWRTTFVMPSRTIQPSSPSVASSRMPEG